MEDIKDKLDELWSAVRKNKTTRPTVEMFDVCSEISELVTTHFKLHAIDVDAELTRANHKFPQLHSPHEGYAVLKEEIEELLENPSKEESIQVAAMCLKFKDMAQYDPTYALEYALQVIKNVSPGGYVDIIKAQAGIP
jgi:hypothetical protein